MPVPHAGNTIRSATGEAFVIGKVLGTGGMGTVVEAKHEQSGRRVALKFLHDELLHHPTIPKRFMREVELSTALSTAHVARTFGVSSLGDGTTFMIMEMLDGKDLCSILRAEGKLNPMRAANIVAQACEALEEAHARGIVHRDVKPENLFVSRAQDGSDWVKVLDFGISKVVDEKPAVSSGQPNGGGRPKLTRVGTTVGTPEYMAPEQLRGAADLDASADVYSLGVVLYEALTAQRPYVSKDYGELVKKICAGEHVPIARLRGDVPPELAETIARAMNKDRKQRTRTARALRESLAPFANAGRKAEWTVVMEPGPPSVPSVPSPQASPVPSSPSGPIASAPVTHPSGGMQVQAHAPMPAPSQPQAMPQPQPMPPQAMIPATVGAPSFTAERTRSDSEADHEASGGRGWIVAVVVVVLLLVAAGAIVLFAPQVVGL